VKKAKRWKKEKDETLTEIHHERITNKESVDIGDDGCYGTCDSYVPVSTTSLHERHDDQRSQSPDGKHRAREHANLSDCPTKRLIHLEQIQQRQVVRRERGEEKCRHQNVEAEARSPGRQKQRDHVSDAFTEGPRLTLNTRLLQLRTRLRVNVAVQRMRQVDRRVVVGTRLRCVTKTRQMSVIAPRHVNRWSCALVVGVRLQTTNTCLVIVIARDWYSTVDFTIVVAQTEKHVDEVDNRNREDTKYEIFDADRSDDRADSYRRHDAGHQHAQLQQRDSEHPALGWQPVGDVSEARHGHGRVRAAAAVQEVTDEEEDDGSIRVNHRVRYDGVDDYTEQRRQNGEPTISNAGCIDED